MKSFQRLSRRERQVMEAVVARGRATVAEIMQAIPDAPTNSATRAILRVLEEKGHLVHEEIGRVYVYRPVINAETARRSALGHLVDTLFAGSAESVVAALLKLKKNRLDPEEAERIARMIEEAAEEGR